MKKNLLLVFALLFLALQLWPVDRRLPPTTAATLEQVEQPPARVAGLLRAACYDCHSNETRYPWYAYVQPAGWYLQGHVEEGRAELNFSEFGRWTPAERRELLDHCAALIEKGKMPLPDYRRMHRGARFSEVDRRLLLAWLRNPQPGAPILSVSDSCDGPDMPVACCFRDQPVDISAALRLNAAGERGEAMVLRGQVLKAGDERPYPNVRLYVYHTDAAGKYLPVSGATGPARWHGRYRGWLRTDAEGRFEIRTIRPAQYPERGAPPAHIHVAAWPPEHAAPFWVTDFVFIPDAGAAADFRQRARRLPGGVGLVELVRENGVWKGERVMVLP